MKISLAVLPHIIFAKEISTSFEQQQDHRNMIALTSEVERSQTIL
jgi:hypothetical protein